VLEVTACPLFAPDPRHWHGVIFPKRVAQFIPLERTEQRVGRNQIVRKKIKPYKSFSIGVLFIAFPIIPDYSLWTMIHAGTTQNALSIFHSIAFD
jgi:hypothetical protein